LILSTSRGNKIKRLFFRKKRKLEQKLTKPSKIFSTNKEEREKREREREREMISLMEIFYKVQFLSLNGLSRV